MRSAAVLLILATGGCSAPRDETRTFLTPLWGHSFSGFNAGPIRAATAPNGDVVVAGGWYGGGFALDGVPSFPEDEGRFVARFDRDGELLWIRALGSPLGMAPEVWPAVSETGIAIAALGGGFDAGSGPIPGVAGKTQVVALLDSSGGERWSTAIEATEVMEFDPAIVLEADDRVVLVNGLRGQASAGTFPLSSDADGDPFIVRFDPQGQVTSARIFPVTSGGGIGFGAMPGPDGDLFLASTIGASIDFGEGPVSAGHSSHVVLARLRPDDSPAWASAYGGGFIGWSFHQWSTNEAGELAFSGIFADAEELPAHDDSWMYALVVDPSTGEPTWGTTFAEGAEGAALIDADGALIGVGGGDGDCTVSRYRSPGKRVEAVRFGDEGLQAFERAVSDGNGGLIATGRSDSELDLDGVIIAPGAFVVRLADMR